jgi:hypothetical protein
MFLFQRPIAAAFAGIATAMLFIVVDWLMRYQ